MWTLEDINEEYPEELYGTVYTEMYKDLYGHRPRGLTWPDLEDFFEDFDRLTDSDYSDNTEQAELEEEELDWMSLDVLREREVYEEVGYDRRMNPDDEWD
jgi:hypothetical protein